MKFARVIFEGMIWAGRIESDVIHLIGKIGSEVPARADEFISYLQSDAAAVRGPSVPLNQVQLKAPLQNPHKIICVGRNYAEHAAEMGSEVKEIPVIFNKFTDAIADPGASIALPSISNAVDYEAELVVVMGREGRHIPEEKALEHIFGFCCGNDISARDWQKGRPGGQWLLGKSFDDFAPLGPWIVTRDQVDHRALDITLQLNGKEMQAANTSQLIFDVPYLIAHLSKFCTLKPGDLLFTGTPAGVGAGRVPPVYLKSGDITSVEIKGLGTLTNSFV